VVAIPADLRVPARVVVTAQSSADEVSQSLTLSSAAAGPLVHVTTDRPVYRPGEPVFVRAVVLDRVTRLPLPTQHPMTAQLLDARDAPIANDQEQAAPAGVGSFRFVLPADSAGGPHQVLVQSQTGAFPPETAEIVVRPFQNPQLKKAIVLDRASYAPGARGAATVTVQRLAAGGAGASGATADAALVIDGTEVWTGKQALGPDGEATFAFTVPKDVSKGAARFVATIDDGGIVETEVKPFVVPTGKVAVSVFPEGGELVANVENNVYLECVDPLGRPIDGAGELLDGRDRTVVRFRTAHQGRAKLAFVPRFAETYKVRLTGRTDTTALPEIRERGLALLLRGDDIATGAPLRMRLLGRGDGPYLLGVFCRGVLVGQTTLRAGDDGELVADAEVPLPAHATGVLRATVFDRTLVPVAERLVRRLAGERLDVALAPKLATVAPGEPQQVTVRTTDERGNPQRAVVGVSVTDLAAVSLGSEPQAGLVDHAHLFADAERTENLGDFFLAHEASGRNVDLLLGTRGWRRFVWRNDTAAQAAIAARGRPAEGTLAREGFSHTPQVVSNLAAAQTPGLELARAVHGAERRLADGAMIGLVLLLIVSLAEAFAWFVRRTWKATPPVQTLVWAGTAGLLMALMVLVPSQIGALAGAAPQPPETAADFDALGAATVLAPQAVPEGTPAFVTFGSQFLAFDAFTDNQLTLTWGDIPETGTSLRMRLASAANAPTANPVAVTRIPLEEAKARVGFLLDTGRGGGGTGSDDFYFARSRRFLEQWRERQYAHQYTPGDERNDFTATVYWNTLVTTDERGEANVGFATSDAVTTWRVHADAHAAQGTGRLGQATAEFSTALPLHVECKLPDEVSAGDRLLLPVTAAVTDPSITEVALSTNLGAGLRPAADVPARIALTEGKGRVLLPITVTDEVGTTTIALEARGGRFTDRVQHRLTIAPRGFPHRRSAGGSAEAGKPSTATIVVPADAVPGSGRVTVKVYPSPIAALTDGLEGILREPHGCFEQASSSNYPNTLVLNLLEANGDDIPVVAARARSLLPAGYRKITGYECKQKGYEWFGADPGHEALTAYGLLQFTDMAKVYDVDAGMVDRTKAWLLGRRDGKGNFPPRDQNHSFGNASGPITNAYVVYALVQAGTPAADLKVEIDALVARSSTDDPYELALIACALHLAHRPEVGAVRERLATLQRADGSLDGTTTTITHSGGRDRAIETTGFAILAWLPDPAFTGRVRTALEFIQGKRDGHGTFGATQATIVALRSLTAYAQAHRATRAPGTLRLFTGERKLAERAFAANETAPLVFELWNELAPGTHELRIDVEGGGGPLAWACDVAYHAEQPADDPDAPVIIATSLRTNAADEGGTVALDVVVANRTRAAVPTPIAIVGLPAGCEIPTRVLEDLQKAEAFASWELKGREVVLYWRSLAAGAEQRLTLDLVARIPGTSTGPASRAWPYYTPAQKRWAAPVAITIAAR
ncbi:MAG: MG2 domain-containing protein, partial [Planctomycetota bacterium]